MLRRERSGFETTIEVHVYLGSLPSLVPSQRLFDITRMQKRGGPGRERGYALPEPIAIDLVHMHGVVAIIILFFIYLVGISVNNLCTLFTECSL